MRRILPMAFVAALPLTLQFATAGRAQEGSYEVDLTAASSSFQVEWHNVASSGMIAKADAVSGGAKRLLRPPFKGAAVLFLHRPR